jgi:hypothetical protein
VSSVLGVRQSAVKITGQVKYYESKGYSGNTVSCGFCPNCGSRLFSKPAPAPDLITILQRSRNHERWLFAIQRRCGSVALVIHSFLWLLEHWTVGTAREFPAKVDITAMPSRHPR